MVAANVSSPKVSSMCKRFSNFFSPACTSILSREGKACDKGRGVRFGGQAGGWKQRRGELSSVTWENVYRYLIKGVSIGSTIDPGMLACPSSLPAPAPGQPWILSRSHPFHVIVTAKSVVVTRVRADKPCNAAAAYRAEPLVYVENKPPSFILDFQRWPELRQIGRLFVPTSLPFPRVYARIRRKVW